MVHFFSNNIANQRLMDGLYRRIHTFLQIMPQYIFTNNILLVFKLPRDSNGLISFSREATEHL